MPGPSSGGLFTCASAGREKNVIFCFLPRSSTVKSSAFRPARGFPLLSVATTSTSTRCVVTRMVGAGAASWAGSTLIPNTILHTTLTNLRAVETATPCIHVLLITTCLSETYPHLNTVCVWFQVEVNSGLGQTIWIGDGPPFRRKQALKSHARRTGPA